jgi:hypothetical protein
MEGNTVISGNIALYGGGVYVSGGTFTMRDSAEVSGNIASSSGAAIPGGGGVCLWGGIFTMEGSSTVSGNTVSNNSLYSSQYALGGGVYVTSGTFRKTGGVIYGDTDYTHTAGSTENTATSGHAVYLTEGKQRNATVGTTVNLYAARASSGESWSYNDASPGGAGDTTANWE